MERLGDWTVAAFKDVDNTSWLIDKLSSSVCAVVSGKMVMSKLHLCVALQRMANAHTLRTRNPLTEVLLMLSPTKNITEALQMFSCDGKERNIILVFRKAAQEDVLAATAAVKGQLVPLDQISSMSDHEVIAKTYNVSATEIAHCGLEAAVVNRIATCDI
jgi:hypothetical protein